MTKERAPWVTSFFPRHSPVYPANPADGDKFFDVRNCFPCLLDPPVKPADDEERGFTPIKSADDGPVIRDQ